MYLSELGISPKKENQFAAKGITSVEALARYLPRKYNDFTEITGLRTDLEKSVLLAVVKSVRTYKNKVPVLQAYCQVVPGGEFLIVTWFHQNHREPMISALIGKTVLIAGKVNKKEPYGNRDSDAYELTTPDIFEENTPAALRVQPVYSKIQGMSDEYLRDAIRKAINGELSVDEPYPDDIIKLYSDINSYQALCYLHFPRSMREVELGRERLLKDDLLFFAACNVWNGRNSHVGSPFQVKSKHLVEKIRNSVPYTLTQDQDKAVVEMLSHAAQGLRINALVQGDVSCGKTIVAALVMAAFIGSGYQAVLMAPTQVLAKQHYEDMLALFSPHGVKVAYLGSDLKAAEKKALVKGIANGDYGLIIGTHSVLSPSISYHDLAIAVTDEEHKFGVVQRDSLAAKASAGVHCVTMSATPIPRSLAQVMYGDTVQLHTILTRPEGRKPVKTLMVSSQEKLYSFIESEAKKGRQTYIVCPMIDANEKAAGMRSVEEVGKQYADVLAPRGVTVATLTGKDKKSDAAETIRRFHSGEINVLVATTVVEVGVNVPTATLIVIVNPERFGLASLHQLRGRVGRSDYQSYCGLDGMPATKEGIERINALLKYDSGFDIAREDLRIRGAGDFVGTRQSGENKYLALMLAYPKEYEAMKDVAARLIDKYNWKPPETDTNNLQ